MPFYFFRPTLLNKLKFHLEKTSRNKESVLGNIDMQQAKTFSTTKFDKESYGSICVILGNCIKNLI